MTLGPFVGRIAAVGLALLLAAPGAASAKAHKPSTEAVHANARAIRTGMAGRHAVAGRYSYRGGVSCVPFARENSGIELSGNAWQWWLNAEGVYQRGARPEVGSVLNFRANGRMRMGHVAVVTNVVDSRNVEIDHANWWGPGAGRGGISRDITVVDVSERNDWSAVRVALGHTNEFGSVYPTYGFIYDRPDRGTMVANNATAPAPALNAPPRDLRPAQERYGATDIEEVAEAVDEPRSRYATRRGAHRLHLSGRAGTAHAGAARIGTARVSTGKVVKAHMPAAAPGRHKPRRT